MHQALISFYYHFHYQQHYFLCHDILEEAWKAQSHYSKNDAVVSLILCATACYHYRRGNRVGASKSFSKALKVIERYDEDDDRLGLDLCSYKKVIQQQRTRLKQGEPFYPVHLPLTTEMEEEIIQVYPEYRFSEEVITNPYIIHHHTERDRTEVVQARRRALQEKQQARLNRKRYSE
ncbi:DUF309 domain-containing protein [Staphylococcus argensis]|uniref:DUF309 domain-containing protein n=1 Tax=Staphylococcus argensis TaxID=1607738 RepID=A0A2K4FFF3_9STAP|nr:DUF309 domain-containing protein [Staphylococcus argensis]MCY6990514.1 DUF309 domain-containing protein [Staphylococcus argensis]POA10023.1 DUF309 domain-containing protein [Staphylococcus argensis]